MPLSSVQIGAIGENLLVNAVMKASDGRLSPFAPIADDDGLDVLFYDKVTGGSVAIQLKCRTGAIRKKNSEERGNTIHFHVRQATFNEARQAFLVAALFNEQLTEFVCTWFIPMALLPEIGKEISGKYVIRPSKAEASADRYTPFRCQTAADLAARIIATCEGQTDPVTPIADKNSRECT
jgi:hypothetical protein